MDKLHIFNKTKNNRPHFSISKSLDTKQFGGRWCFVLLTARLYLGGARMDICPPSLAVLAQVLSVEVVDEFADRGFHGGEEHHLEFRCRDDVELHHVDAVCRGTFVDALKPERPCQPGHELLT